MVTVAQHVGVLTTTRNYILDVVTLYHTFHHSNKNSFTLGLTQV